MGALHFRPEADIREAVDRTFSDTASLISDLLPEARIEHIGATAIPGSLTKGDLDVLVRVPEDALSAAVESLRSHFAIYQPENWTPTFASFKKEAAGEIPVGIQLAVLGSFEDKTFLALLELLRSNPDLLKRYNDLKRSHEGGDPEAYLADKAEFFERLLPLA